MGELTQTNQGYVVAQPLWVGNGRKRQPSSNLCFFFPSCLAYVGLCIEGTPRNKLTWHITLPQCDYGLP